ncbi:hypothetical protein BaRGS_00021029 [Batillaria attramentaria]|uniref:Uncharacterized protein n=1 Tax=Batillaria attramentaria TaxID=370345 RepID=A0ABD0KL26_9CAEN
MGRKMTADLPWILIVFSLFVVFWTEAAGSDPLDFYSNRKSTVSGYSCKLGEQAHIVDAFYKTTPDKNVCDLHCQAIDASGVTPEQCVVVEDENGTIKCRQRLSRKDLNAMYRRCGVTAPNCHLQPGDKDYPLSSRKPANVVYMCIPENDTIDPCENLTISETTRALMLKGETLKKMETCHSECVLTPLGHHSDVVFSYSLLRQELGATEDTIQYRITYSTRAQSADASSWETLHSPFYFQMRRLYHVKELRLKFNITNMKRMTRVWVSVEGAPFNIKCTVSQATYNDAKTTSETSKIDNKLRCSNSSSLEATLVTPAAGESRGGDPGVILNRPYTLLIGFAAGIVLTCAFFVGILMWKRRRGKTESPLRRRHLEAGSCNGPKVGSLEPRVTLRHTATSTNFHEYAEIRDIQTEPVVDAGGYLCPFIKSPQLSVGQSSGYLHPTASPSGSDLDQSDVSPPPESVHLPERMPKQGLLGFLMMPSSSNTKDKH